MLKKAFLFLLVFFLSGLMAHNAGFSAKSVFGQDQIEPRRGGPEPSSGESCAKSNPSQSISAETVNKTQQTGRLFVKTQPEGARVRVLNIRPKFYQGMPLRPGKYHIEVSVPGHELKKDWVEVAAGEDKKLYFHLVEDKAKYTPSPTRTAFTNSLGMRFVYIEPGTFLMGSPSSEFGRDDDEQQHQVTLTQGFFMAVTEVTQGQWRLVMGNNPADFKNCGNDCPVENVSWNECREFIERLNRKEKTDKYRLPTEAEWEYACRAGSKTEIYTGSMEVLSSNNAPALGEIAWYGGNSCAEYEGAVDCSGWGGKQVVCPRCGPQPVSRKKPNKWGLYDTLGNVWEWCQDWEGEYPAAHVTDPVGPPSGDFRVCRGGSWDSFALGSRAAARFSEEPHYKDNTIGFRLAMTP